MSNLERWLDEHELGKYTELLLENEIDLDVLEEITLDELKELGIPLGARKRFMKAVAALGRGDVSDSALAPIAGLDADKSVSSGEAERRQLTVVFCDLVGSTELTRMLDPEDMRRVIRFFQGRCEEEIERHEGFLARYMGDGVLAYFGYPRAQEDDPERAVRAGLAIVAALEAGPESQLMDAPHELPLPALKTRIGIATGPVVAGDLIGKGASRESPVVGETPHLAARLQGAAEPGTVVVSPATRELVRGRFHFATRGERLLKGLNDPLRIWEVTGEADSRSRFAALQRQRLTPLTGREEELAILTKRWRQTQEGEGQVVLITGEPGIGKSRLFDVLLESFHDAECVPLGFQCAAHHVDDMLHPVIVELKYALGYQEPTTASEKLGRLEAYLASIQNTTHDDLRSLAALLAIPGPASANSSAANNKLLRDQSIAAVQRVIECLCRTGPRCMQFEDLHWADPSTLELVGRLVESASRLPLLLVLTARPEFSFPQAGELHLTTLALSRVSRRESRAMINTLLAGRELPDPLIEELVSRTDGVPLFIEEVARAVVEAMDEPAADGPAKTAVEVPASLQDSLMSRIDRLTVGRRIAQLSAAIGREFTRDMLEAISKLDPTQVSRGIDELVGAGLIFRRGEGGYSFKHALVQEVAYGTLLRTQRGPLHEAIATELETFSPDAHAVLAHHWELAGEIERALSERLLASDYAQANGAQWEAVAHRWKLLELLDRLPAAESLAARHVDAVIGLIEIRSNAFWSDDQTKAAAAKHIDRAIQTATDQGNMTALARLEAFKGHYWNELPPLLRALAAAESCGDKRAEAEVARRVSGYHGALGSFNDSRKYLRRTAQLYAELGADLDLGMVMAGPARCYSCRAGHMSESLDYAHQAYEIGERTGDLRLQAWRAMEAEPLFYMGLWSDVIERAERWLPVAWDIGEWSVVLWATAWSAIAHVQLSQLDSAQKLIAQVLEEGLPKMTGNFPKGYVYLARSQLELAMGNIDAAIGAALAVREIAERDNQKLELGAARRTLGLAYAANGQAVDAEVELQGSIAVLETIQADPELAQSYLAFGRFKLRDDQEAALRSITRAQQMFDAMGATGWLEILNESIPDGLDQFSPRTAPSSCRTLIP